MRNFLIILSLSIVAHCAIAQDELALDSMQIDSIGALEPDTYFELSKIQLPPLSVFLNAANNYADVKYYDEKIEEENLQLKIAKREWLKYLRLQTNYQYGTNSALTSRLGDQLPIESPYSTTTQSFYNAGVVLSVPLDDLFSRKQQNNIVRARVRQIEYEAERALESRQIIILQAYNEVNKHLAIIKVKAEAVALYNAQMAISEKDFSNGRISIIDLSLERMRRATAIVNFQESRAELHNAVTLLEMLTKVKIIQ